jgi:hypothetical protein
VSQAIAVLQIVGRNLSAPLSMLPAHQRAQVAGQLNKLAGPIALVLLAALAYKFWA